jgi:ribose transport system ATP-binding protein
VSRAMLELRGITRTFFGVHALREINLDVGAARVLGLVGQNGAGKSTLMNVIGGVLRPDAGTMHLDAEAYAPRQPSDASSRGIAFIHQELNLFTNLTIAENIFLDRFPVRRVGPFAVIDRNALRTKAGELLAQVNLDLAPDTPVDRLSPGEKQLVEVAKALQVDARIIIFDEPTTSLTARETERLFALVDRLRAAGKTMIYISHILIDVMRLADDIAILRDGKLVEAGEKSTFDVGRMISLMVGRDIEQLYPERLSAPSEEVVLLARGLSARGLVENIDLTLHGGEVLGVFGLMGSGRTELARILFGVERFDRGEIAIGARTVTRTSPRKSIANRVAFITENRREEGLMMSLSIADNIALAALPSFAIAPLKVVDQTRMLVAAREIAAALQIKAGAVDVQPAKSLSGGNQQKVVIAKWLMSGANVFVMDEPTRGVDVGAKYEIYSIINELAADGSGLLFISSEIEELMAMCDRILVMSRGEIVTEFARSAFDKEQILSAAFREHEAAA